MTAYYNEVDPCAAAWLRNLIAAGHIAPGDVDERSVVDVRPGDLAGYTQCHFFAGIGVWSYALRRAGWPDDEPVWTGSCPCQPFSAAGKGEGTDDARHLWPEWFRLIREHRPVVIVGEQVGAAIRHGWLDLVSADLEGLDYAVGSAVMGAHSVGAPHIRQRLYFVADAMRGRTGHAPGQGVGAEAASNGENGGVPRERLRARIEGSSGELADADGRDASAEGLQRGGEHGLEPQDGGTGRLEHAQGDGREQRRAEPSGRCAAGGCCEVLLGYANDERPQGRRIHAECAGERAARPASVVGAAAGVVGNAESHGREMRGHLYGELRREGFGEGCEPRVTNGFWNPCDWLPCIDGKARPVEPGTFPLAHGAPARVGRLRAYGNAIVAPVAEEFIRAYRMTINPALNKANRT